MTKMRNIPVLAMLLASSVVGSVTAERSEAQAADRTVGSVEAYDGVVIRYEVVGRGGPALVFVHGWSCDRTYWRAQTDHFAAAHRVVAIDLGGHGESGQGRDDWTIESFAQDVRAVVEALGLREVVLLGHSMGGSVIADAARLMPDRVTALVIVDAFHEVERAITPEERELFFTPILTDFRAGTEALVKQFMFTASSDSNLVERIARDMAAAPPAVGISALENLFEYDEAAALAAVAVPVHLLNADLWPTDLEAARRHKPDAALTVMPGVGHFLMMEDPEEFNRLLARAVQQVTNE